jgi:hypothetical protein
MTTPFDELCKLGQKGDQLLSVGNFTEAFHVFTDIHARMRAQRTIDSFVASKLALSSILVLIYMENLRGALQVWTSYRSDLPGGDGFKDENGQVSLDDFILYQQISAYLSAACEQPEIEAERAVNHYFGVAHKISRAESRADVSVLLSNWRKCLSLALRGKEPKIWPVELQAVRAEPLRGGVVFPTPSQWRITWDSLRASA